MFDIYEALKSGMTPEELAETFSKSLNEAENRIAQEEAEQARLAKEAEERAELERTKKEDFTDVISELLRTIGEHYPEFQVEATEEVAGAIADLVIMSIDLERMRGRHQIKVNVKPVRLTKSPVNVDEHDVFAKFFKQFGLN